MTFAELGLSKKALSALEHAGFEAPTPIQAQAIPPALQGRDVVGSAATGTGKTLAFVLPMLERLFGKHGTRGLVLAPTRELALQIEEQVERFRNGYHLRSAAGDRRRRHVAADAGLPEGRGDHRRHARAAQRPPRLRQRAGSGSVEILVLDEADRMLDMGFLPQIRRILKHLPRERQSLLFSATMAGEVASSRARTCATRCGWRWRAAERPPSGRCSRCSSSARRRRRRCCSRSWSRISSPRWSSPAPSAARTAWPGRCSAVATTWR